MILSKTKGSNNKTKKKEQFFLIYYVVMLGLLIFMTKPNNSFSEIIRLGYLILIMAPLVLNSRFVPFVIVCFYGICSNSFYSLLPEEHYYCILFTLTFAFIHIKRIQIRFSHVIIPITFLVYCIIVNVLHNDMDQKFITTGIIAILICPFIKKEEDVKTLALGLCLMSFVLSILYFMNFQYYSVSIDNEEFERGTWQNMNMMAGSIGIGLPLSTALLLNIIKGEKPKWLRIALITNCIVIAMALASLSSRGSMFASVLCSVALIPLSKIKNKYKVIFIAVAFVLLAALYVVGLFDLFIYRMTEEGSTATLSGRTTIWERKLIPFFKDSGLIQMFGMGRNECTNYGIYYSTHNDYVTALVGYGYIGFLLTLFFVFNPILKANKKDFLVVLALTFYYVVECMVLEPFFRGHYAIWMYYVFTLKYASTSKKTKKAEKRFSAYQHKLSEETKSTQ